MKKQSSTKLRTVLRNASLISAIILGSTHAWAAAPGTWTKLKNLPADSVGTMLLRTDGSIMVQGYNPGNNWNRLTPTSTGNYVTGTWSAMPSMGIPRLYFASHILPNGDVWVLGGEYSGFGLPANWTRTGEKFSISTNTWSPIAPHPESQYGDVPSMLLDGNKIIAGSLFNPTTFLYDIATNTWSSAGSKVYTRSDEESWVKLAGGKVLTYDIFKSVDFAGSYAELYNPATNTWSSISPSDGSALGSIPALSSSALGYEIGASVRLCDGRIFAIGATGATALYTPATNTWSAGPSIPGGYKADDAPATVMRDCHVMLTAELGHFIAPTKVFDFNPTANTITEIVVPAQLASQLNTPSYVTRLLVLPSGLVLLSTSSQQLWVYTPGAQVAASTQLRPLINTVVPNTSTGIFSLTGLRITGQSAGGSYGDDAESDQNYPIVSLKNTVTNKTFYARTSNWSTTDVGTGTVPVSTDFCIMPGTPDGQYKVTVSAAGLLSTNTKLIDVNPINVPFYCH